MQFNYHISTIVETESSNYANRAVDAALLMFHDNN